MLMGMGLRDVLKGRSPEAQRFIIEHARDFRGFREKEGTYLSHVRLSRDGKTISGLCGDCKVEWAVGSGFRVTQNEVELPQTDSRWPKCVDTLKGDAVLATEWSYKTPGERYRLAEFLAANKDVFSTMEQARQMTRMLPTFKSL